MCLCVCSGGNSFQSNFGDIKDNFDLMSQKYS